YHAVFLTTAPDLNQIQPNTIGYANLSRTARPFPNWNRVNSRENGGDAHYNDFTAQIKGKGLAGWSYTASYKWAKGISNDEDSFSRVLAGNFNEEIAGRTDNRFDGTYLRGPIGSIPYHRFTTDFLWELPFGHNRRFGSHWNKSLAAVASGWTLSGIV